MADELLKSPLTERSELQIEGVNSDLILYGVLKDGGSDGSTGRDRKVKLSTIEGYLFGVGANRTIEEMKNTDEFYVIGDNYPDKKRTKVTVDTVINFLVGTANDNNYAFDNDDTVMIVKKTNAEGVNERVRITLNKLKGEIRETVNHFKTLKVGADSNSALSDYLNIDSFGNVRLNSVADALISAISPSNSIIEVVAANSDNTINTTAKMQSHGTLIGGNLLGIPKANASFIILNSSNNVASAIGTTSNSDFVISTNNIERARFLATGLSVVFGTEIASIINTTTNTSAIVSARSQNNTLSVNNSVILEAQNGSNTGNIGGVSRANSPAIFLSSSNNSPAVIFTTTNSPLVFGTNNVERIRILTNGRIGIGTATPGNALELFNVGNILNRANNSGNPSIISNLEASSIASSATIRYSEIYAKVTSANTVSVSMISFHVTTNTTDKFFGINKSNAGFITFTGVAGIPAGIGTYSNIDLVLGTNNIERVRITSTGIVVIGSNTVEAGKGLQVVDLGEIENKSTTTSAVIRSRLDAAAITPDTNIRSSEVIAHAVGQGTDIVWTSLRSYAKTTNTTSLLFGIAKSNAGFLVIEGGTVAGIGTLLSTDLVFGTNNIERMRIFTDGRIAMGTSSPEAGNGLEVFNLGNIKCKRTSATSVEIIAENDASAIAVSATQRYSTVVSLVKSPSSVNIYGYISAYGTSTTTEAFYGIIKSNTVFLNLNGVSGTPVGIGSTSNSDLVFGTNNIERMRISSVGAIGINSVVDSGWGTSTYVVMQFGPIGALWCDKTSNPSSMHISSGIFYDGANHRSFVNEKSSLIRIGAGNIEFRTLPAATFTTVVAPTTRAIINDKGMGIGSTPNVGWNGENYGVLQIGSAASLFAHKSTSSNGLNIVSGAYYDGSNWRTFQNRAGSRVWLDSGSVGFDTSDAATIDATTTFTERMRITADGTIGIGIIPKTWHATYKTAIQIGSGGAIWSNNSGNNIMFLSTGLYYNGQWRVINANKTMTSVTIGEGEFVIMTAAANATAGADVTSTLKTQFTVNTKGVGIGSFYADGGWNEVVSSVLRIGSAGSLYAYNSTTANTTILSSGTYFDGTSRRTLLNIEGSFIWLANGMIGFSYTGAAAVGSAVGTVDRMRIAADGTVGIGTIPAVWDAVYKSTIQLAAGGAIWGHNTGSSLLLTCGVYYNAGYKALFANKKSSMVDLSEGVITFRTISSNTLVGGAVSSTQRMSVTDTGVSVGRANANSGWDTDNFGVLQIGYGGALWGHDTASSATTYLSHGIYQNSAGTRSIQPATEGCYIWLRNGSIGFVHTSAAAAGATTTDTERMRINSNGQVDISGNLSMGGRINKNIANTTIADIMYVVIATNDHFAIRSGGTAPNGWVSFDTGDDGSEEIYFRQYQAAAVKNQVTLLDASGNSIFPKTVTAEAFAVNTITIDDNFISTTGDFMIRTANNQRFRIFNDGKMAIGANNTLPNAAVGIFSHNVGDLYLYSNIATSSLNITAFLDITGVAATSSVRSSGLDISVKNSTATINTFIYTYAETTNTSTKIFGLNRHLLGVIGTTNAPMALGTYNGHDLTIGTSNTPRIFIASNGRIGIGSATNVRVWHSAYADSVIQIGAGGAIWSHNTDANSSMWLTCGCHYGTGTSNWRAMVTTRASSGIVMENGNIQFMTAAAVSDLNTALTIKYQFSINEYGVGVGEYGAPSGFGSPVTNWTKDYAVIRVGHSGAVFSYHRNPPTTSNATVISSGIYYDGAAIRVSQANRAGSYIWQQNGEISFEFVAANATIGASVTNVKRMLIDATGKVTVYGTFKVSTTVDGIIELGTLGAIRIANGYTVLTHGVSSDFKHTTTYGGTMLYLSDGSLVVATTSSGVVGSSFAYQQSAIIRNSGATFYFDSNNIESHYTSPAVDVYGSIRSYSYYYSTKIQAFVDRAELDPDSTNRFAMIETKVNNPGSYSGPSASLRTYTNSNNATEAYFGLQRRAKSFLLFESGEAAIGTISDSQLVLGVNNVARMTINPTRVVIGNDDEFYGLDANVKFHVSGDSAISGTDRNVSNKIFCKTTSNSSTYLYKAAVCCISEDRDTYGNRIHMETYSYVSNTTEKFFGIVKRGNSFIVATDSLGGDYTSLGIGTLGNSSLILGVSNTKKIEITNTQTIVENILKINNFFVAGNENVFTLPATSTGNTYTQTIVPTSSNILVVMPTTNITLTNITIYINAASLPVGSVLFLTFKINDFLDNGRGIYFFFSDVISGGGSHLSTPRIRFYIDSGYHWYLRTCMAIKMSNGKLAFTDLNVI